jgi:hypothetical protein
MGKELQAETEDMCADLSKADAEGRVQTTSFLGDTINQVDTIVLRIREHKLILKAEEPILRSLASLGQLFRKTLSAIESSKAKKLEDNNGSSSKADRIPENNLSFGEELLQFI